MFHPQTSKWYAPESTKVAVCYRKALAKINLLASKPETDSLKSMICTNLANHLSSQGRAFCCIELYDEAIRLDNNPVAYVAKARNELFVAGSLCDLSHSQYHYYTAAKLLKQLEPYKDQLEPEQRPPIEQGGMLHDFNEWFQGNFSFDYFDSFKTFKEEFESEEQAEYLKWCGENRLFLNDLNDVCKDEIVYQDVLALSSFVSDINPIIIESEKLAYHVNYDEIKNDYCYARYLMHQAYMIEDEEKHYFNNTYKHVDGYCGNLDNLKVSHLKSSFQTLYSLFDKIAYFLHRFFDLNDISKDNKIYIDKLFRKLNGNKWKPNDKLEDGRNFFINALFFILQDLRDVEGHESVSKWVDPDTKAFSEIRNAIEHRSLVIVDGEIYDLSVNYNAYAKMKSEELDKELSDLVSDLESIGQSISAARKAKDTEQLSELMDKRKELESKCKKIEQKKYEKQKLSTHTLHVSIEEFEKRLFTLIKLVRTSIMYLSLAINLDTNFKKENQKGFAMPREIPLKN
ncbi:LA2681 family HEPN domain-containing protein [Vibrio parahaemolyticus]|uniref:LA2681 family HEPN domain-containing protein n=1 Tax=Vibrio parahaemolyticus TaxID=670 RepID=UPI0018E0901B|nr:LA2681 family HEPN domain-containing protein [Vibrio parahaemolyticus]